LLINTPRFHQYLYVTTYENAVSSALFKTIIYFYLPPQDYVITTSHTHLNRFHEAWRIHSSW